MPNETAQERRDRLNKEYDTSMAGFVYGIIPRPVSRFTRDIYGVKHYQSFEDYLNG